MERNRGLKLVTTAALSVVLTASAALAAPHFHSATSSVTNNGALAVSFDERGVGHDDIDYLLEADASATWACFNRGGKNPSAANKQTQSFPVVTTESFASKNGRVVATISSDPPSPGDFSCPGGQVLRLADVTYTNIVLTDLTSGVSTGVPDASRTFFTV